jgi:hypothetical protein
MSINLWVDRVYNLCLQMSSQFTNKLLVIISLTGAV